MVLSSTRSTFSRSTVNGGNGATMDSPSARTAGEATVKRCLIVVA